MAKRKCFSKDEILSHLRNIPDDVSECEASGSECDYLYNPEQDSDSSFSNESESNLSKSFNSLPDLSDRFSKRFQIQNELKTTKASQEINVIDATLSASNNQEENEQSSDITSGTAQNELPALVVYDNTGSSDQGCELEAFLIEFKFEFKFTKICKFEFFKFQFFEFEFEFTK